MEVRFTLGAPIHAIEHQTVQMDIQVGCRANSLYQRNSAGVGCCAFEPRLLEHKPRDDAVDDAQHRCEQFTASNCAASVRGKVVSNSASCNAARPLASTFACGLSCASLSVIDMTSPLTANP